MHTTPDPADLLLSWPAPAADWHEAAPVGNGRLGAMVFGGAHRGRIQINDSTVWSGTPDGPAAALADVVAGGAGPRRLAEVRAALRDGDRRTAESLLMTFEGPYSQEYLPYADLWLTVDGGERAVHHGRTLNLDSGVAAEEFTLGGTAVSRRTWADAVSGTLCTDLTAVGGTVGLRLELTTPLREVQRAADQRGITLGVEIPVDGAPAHEPAVAEPLRYATGPVGGYDPFGALAVRLATDGEVTVAITDGSLRITGATRLLVTVASSTRAHAHWSGRPGPGSREVHLDAAAGAAGRAAALGAEALLAQHEGDLRGLLGGSALRVGPRRSGTYDVSADILSGRDELLTATVLFQFGRYLLAAASRPRTGPPANLQGIWNADLRPAWSSNYTVNINTQMNYWGAEAAGLPACHEPLFDLLDRVAAHGTDVARELYGARGWVAHHNTDMWGWALPVGMGHGNPSWAIWMMGGAWLSQHLWDHYDFTRDTAFLRERAWPLLRGCSAFLLDWLVDEDRPGGGSDDGGGSSSDVGGSDEGSDGHGYLRTLPSTSPENLFLSEQGRPESLTHSSAMDLWLIRAAFERTLRAAALLGLQDPLTDEIQAALPRLPLPRISPVGLLQEWADDLPEQDPAHRHLSPLVGLHPLGLVDPDTAPEFALAARRLLDRRGPGAMGWSWAWKMSQRAWLRDAVGARELLLEAARPLDGDAGTDAPVDGSRWGGLLPNLFSTHPPFQIDGSYGFMAAITEMVLQSHTGTVHLLPALPAQWSEGDARDLRCRGGLSVDLAWDAGVLTGVTLRRIAGDPAEPVRVRCGDRTAEVTVEPGTAFVLDGRLRPVRAGQEAGAC
ncbi:glycosyl hydrolase family 95 catalytic domain-containing protein [Actinacidiphila acidipaludis]|uniref:Glycoside hydrolase family 95 protein n=1 Tax=Actinacidiphila acidipaludis TaxID=2873382 RepID=A0ABS7QAJ4_9ACTN|nr:glycoside hydrolase N-terminal domain-containing protein [Streptomyces acidipaludis]MBY8879002.1 glycoside hydrolase family 95 protein [Streptomyces acidipaludis]